MINDRSHLECWGKSQITLKNNNKRIKNIIIGSSFICTLYDEGNYSCGKINQKLITDQNINLIELPDDFKKDIKHMSGERSICTVKNSGELGCWDPNSLIFDKLVPK